MLWPTGLLPDSKDGSLAINGIGHLSKLRLANHMITSILRGLEGKKSKPSQLKLIYQQTIETMKLNIIRCMYGYLRAKAQISLFCALWLRQGPKNTTAGRGSPF